MKYIYIFYSFLLITSFSSDQYTYLQKQGFKYIPSGEIILNGQNYSVTSFYMFETEITNREYFEFLNDLKKQGKTEEYKISRIDSTGWNKALNFDNSYAQDYHLTSAFAEYPVVNISHQAANLFCIWLQNKLGKKVKNIEVRLPRDYEWMYAAKGGNQNAEYPWQSITKNYTSDYNFCNYNSPEDGTCLATNYAKSYLPNAYGLYNMSGNVAEMLDVTGNTKGGSWNSDALHMKINAEDEYRGISSPSPYIGFRPVVIIK